MATERRDTGRRGEVFQRIVRSVLENSAATFTFDSFQALLGVPEAAARRILDHLVTAGILEEDQRGVWSRTWSHVRRAPGRVGQAL